MCTIKNYPLPKTAANMDWTIYIQESITKILEQMTLLDDGQNTTTTSFCSIPQFDLDKYKKISY